MRIERQRHEAAAIQFHHHSIAKFFLAEHARKYRIVDCKNSGEFCAACRLLLNGEGFSRPEGDGSGVLTEADSNRWFRLDRHEC